jgi:hypothetical protein
MVALVLVPLFLYAFYIFTQLDNVREHQLRRLDSAARAAEELLGTARRNVVNLRDHSEWEYVCWFFQRQTRLRLDDPRRCDQFLDAAQDTEVSLDETNGRLWILGHPRQPPAEEAGPEPTAEPERSAGQEQGAEAGASPSFKVEVLLHALLEENPFSDAFEQLFVVNDEGKRMGAAVRPRRSSPMLPPRVTAPPSPSPVRAPDLEGLRFVGGDDDATATFKGFNFVSFAHPVELAGKRYTLMCHPWSLNVGSSETAPKTWWLCGLTDSRRSLRAALQVSPQRLILTLALVTIVVVALPILKVLSLAPRERLRFVDLYLNVLATLALVMLLTVWIAYVGAHEQLRARSADRLEALAETIESSLLAELRHMLDQLEEYDHDVHEELKERAGVQPEAERDELRFVREDPILIGCLLLDAGDRGDADCEAEGASPPALGASSYPHMQNLFWMQPCNGRQVLKGTARPNNTPIVELAAREYFRAIVHDRYWQVTALPTAAYREPAASRSVDEGGEAAEVDPRGGEVEPESPASEDTSDAEQAVSDTRESGFFVETSASITTGEFFAALSIPSRLTRKDVDLVPDDGGDPICAPDDDERFVAAMTSQPVSVRYPILAPGVAFAVADQRGTVLFHSDERRAVFENLLEDDGLAAHLRAALATRSKVDFEARYRTRPHQIHVRPVEGLPWFVITFADDEVLSTFRAELLTRTAVLLGAFLLFAFLGTLGYMAVRGRQPPVWMWPRRERRYRKIYLASICSLVAQLAVFIFALASLRGEMLMLACLSLPLAALGTTAVAARAAKALDAAPGAEGDVNPSSWDRYQLRNSALLVTVSVLLLLALLLTMEGTDPVAAAQAAIATGRSLRVVLSALVVALAVVVAVVVVPDAWIQPARRDQRKRASSAREHTASGGAAEHENVWRRFWRHPLTPHITGAMLFWVILGAMPAFGLFEFALAREKTVLTKAEQAYLARAAAWSTCRLREDLRLVPGGDQLVDPKIELARLRFDGPGSADDTDPPSDRRADDAPAYGYVYPEALLSRLVTHDSASFKKSSRQELSRVKPVWEALARRAPVYNDTTTYTRYLEHSVSAADSDGSSWSWWAASKRRAALPVLVYSQRALNRCEGAVPMLASRPPDTNPLLHWSVPIMAGIALVLLFAWVSYAARRLFFGEIEEDAAPGGGSSAGSRNAHLEPHLGSADRPPTLAWAEAEIAPIKENVSFPELAGWCKTCSTRRGVLDRVLERSETLYEQLWNRRTEEEQLLLVQLVEEGFANHKQPEVVRTLLKVGLLRRDPILRPMNHSFAMFVESRADPDHVRRQEHAHHGLRWSLVRNVLLAALVLAFLFFSVTQREAVQVWIAYLGAAAGGVAGVLKLLSLMSRPGVQKPGEL